MCVTRASDHNLNITEYFFLFLKKIVFNVRMKLKNKSRLKGAAFQYQIYCSSKKKEKQTITRKTHEKYIYSRKLDNSSGKFIGNENCAEHKIEKKKYEHLKNEVFFVFFFLFVRLVLFHCISLSFYHRI